MEPEDINSTVCSACDHEKRHKGTMAQRTECIFDWCTCEYPYHVESLIPSEMIEEMWLSGKYKSKMDALLEYLDKQKNSGDYFWHYS